jgi:hypothetical protein
MHFLILPILRATDITHTGARVSNKVLIEGPIICLFLDDFSEMSPLHEAAKFQIFSSLQSHTCVP